MRHAEITEPPCHARHKPDEPHRLARGRAGEKRLKVRIHLIELIDDGFAAAIYTQTTDVEVEVNGLMTYDRKVLKLDMDRLSAINRKVIESM